MPFKLAGFQNVADRRAATSFNWTRPESLSEQSLMCVTDVIVTLLFVHLYRSN